MEGFTENWQEYQLTCSMKHDCCSRVTYIDNRRYTYCTTHGLQRKAVARCRKLTAKETRILRSGGAISY